MRRVFPIRFSHHSNQSLSLGLSLIEAYLPDRHKTGAFFVFPLPPSLSAPEYRPRTNLYKIHRVTHYPPKTTILLSGPSQAATMD